MLCFLSGSSCCSKNVAVYFLLFFSFIFDENLLKKEMNGYTEMANIAYVTLDSLKRIEKEEQNTPICMQFRGIISRSRLLT